MRKKPELLAPAGDMEKLRMAVLYGADAVYLAGKSFGMRSAPSNFTNEELEEAVRPCGFYRTKAKSIKEMAGQLINNFGGEIPDNMEDLLTISGIGRKTANLMMGDVWGKPAIVTDTHFIRITGRLGLTNNKEPRKVEEDLVKLIPPEVSSDFCHRIVQFGRDVCRARNPKCIDCICGGFCKYFRGLKKGK